VVLFGDPGELMTRLRASILVAFILSVAGNIHATTVNPFTDLGSAGPSNWQILTLGGDSCGTRSGCGSASTNVIIKNASEVDGNVGIAPKGNITGGPNGAAVYGNLDLDTAGTATINGSYTFTGTFNQNSATDTLLNNAANAALLAYSDASGMTVTNSTYTNINNPASAITITGSAGINVIDLSNLVLSSSTKGLTLSGPSNAYFVINVSGNFSVTNGADITVTGGLPQFNVLYNVTGTGSAVTFTGTSGSTDVQGIVLAPYRDITVTGSEVDGEVISGNLNLTVQNNSTIDAPEPTTLIFLATGLAGLGVRFRRSRQSQ
jgi:choice-of-anchor A domain-containing protein